MASAVQSQRVTLAANQELRLECDPSKPVTLKLEEGSAEIFGAEIQLGNSVTIHGDKLAVYTWEGCKLFVTGQPTIMYEASETPMASYLNVHQTLNARRQAAKEGEGVPGPRVIVVGPADSGKSSVCKMLINWAVRSGWQPTYVDLDVGQGSVTVPGCLAATPIESPICSEEGYPLEMPLVYYFGHTSPSENPQLYKHLVERLAAVLDKRAAASPSAGASGLIINTLGWVDGLGYELQKHAVQAFKADVVIVMEQDRLHAQMSADLKGSTPPVSVVKLAKSGGVVKREADERRKARERRIREYFYGSGRQVLSPAMQASRAEQMVVYRIGGGPRAPSSALPLGTSHLADPLRLQNLPANVELVQALLAVSNAATPDQILVSNAAGFVLVKDVETATGQVRYLSPCPGALPGRYLITGSMRSAID